MNFQRLNRNDPEQMFVEVTNVDARSLTQGYPVALRLGTVASLNFNNAVLALSGTAADLPGFLGIADQDIATNAVGRVVTYGYAKSVFLSAVGTSLTATNGDPLIPGAGGLFSGAPTYANGGFKYVILKGSPGTISASAWASGFVKGGL